jgi:NADPH-dependent 2,4-dienoyl-CoA reductase/sulfur reductase-like enzyme
MGRFVLGLHEAEGVRFHLQRTADRFEGGALILDDGTRIPCDLVVLGVGVRPRVGLAVEAGLAADDGVVVDRSMRASAPGVWAAGDIARYPGPDGAMVRIEHWVAAQRQGQVAALSMLGEPAELDDPPFFWSQHYDAVIRYVGHAIAWDETAIEGSLAARDATVRYLEGGALLAAASVGRDAESLEIERSLRAEAAA